MLIFTLYQLKPKAALNAASQTVSSTLGPVWCQLEGISLNGQLFL